MIAVLFCIIIFLLRGRKGAVFYSIIATLQCIQPYTTNMLKVGRNRIIGTLVGAFWGSQALFAGLWISGGVMNFHPPVIYYMILVVLISDAGSGRMVKELKKRYEPISLKGWRNIVHF